MVKKDSLMIHLLVLVHFASLLSKNTALAYINTCRYCLFTLTYHMAITCIPHRPHIHTICESHGYHMHSRWESHICSSAIPSKITVSAWYKQIQHLCLGAVFLLRLYSGQLAQHLPHTIGVKPPSI